MVATTPTPTPLSPRRRRRASAMDEQTVTVGRTRAGTIAANTVGILFALFMIFPVYWVLNTAFKPASEVLSYDPSFWPKHPTFDNFVSAVKAPLFLRDLGNGLIVTIAAVIGSLIIGFLASLAIARFRFFGRRAIILVILTVQLIPLISLLIPLFLLLQNPLRVVGAASSVDLTNNLASVALVYVVLILPYTVWTLRGFIAGIPRELDEAALIDGCTRFQTFWRIILPLTGPGLVATSIYGFIQAWNEFLIINTVNHTDKQNAMAWLLANQTTRGTAWGPLMAGAIISSLPVVIFFLIIQRRIATGLTAGAVKG
jgi:N,N'-diacetylchitobiose transport system permease protein